MHYCCLCCGDLRSPGIKELCNGPLGLCDDYDDNDVLVMMIRVMLTSANMLTHLVYSSKNYIEIKTSRHSNRLVYC